MTKTFIALIWLVTSASFRVSWAQSSTTSTPPGPNPTAAPQATLPTGGYVIEDCDALVDAVGVCLGGVSLPEDHAFLGDACTLCRDGIDYDNEIATQPTCAAIRSALETAWAPCYDVCAPAGETCSELVWNAYLCSFTEAFSPPECNAQPTSSPVVSYPTATPTWTGPGAACQTEYTASFDCAIESPDENSSIGSEACTSCAEANISTDLYYQQCSPDLSNLVRAEYMKCQEECYPSTYECNALLFESVVCTTTDQYTKLCENGASDTLDTSRALHRRVAGSVLMSIFWLGTALLV